MFNDVMQTNVSDHIKVSVTDESIVMEKKSKENANHRVELKENFYISRFDYINSDENSKFYLTNSNKALLRFASTSMEVEKRCLSSNGKFSHLNVRLKFHESRPKKLKVMYWLSDISPATMNVFDNFLVPDKKHLNIMERINPNSWCKIPIYLDSSLVSNLKVGERFEHEQVCQAERIGYMAVDGNSTPKDLQFNVICMHNVHLDMRNNIFNAAMPHSVARWKGQ